MIRRKRPLQKTDIFSRAGSSNSVGASGVGPSGGMPSQYVDPGANRDSPFSRSGKTIAGITTQRQRGLQVIDINPYTVPKKNFPCTVPAQMIGDLFGWEVGGDFSNSFGSFRTALDFLSFGAVENTTTNILPPQLPPQDFTPFWRTIPIPVVGTFLKIDFLPARVNDESIYALNYSQGTANPPAPQLETTDQTSLYSAMCKTPGGVNQPGQTGSANCVAGGSNWIWNDNSSADNLLDQEFSTKNSSSDCILIQFEDPNSTPLIVKPGDTFKIPFNTVYVTFKIRNPRIRVTIGNNAEVFNGSETQKTVNSTLHMAPGRGILDHSVLHPVPFCLDVKNTFGVGGAITVNAASTVSQALFQNQKTISGFVGAGAIPPGVNVGWLTALNFMVWAASGTTNATYTVRLSIIRTTAYVTGGGSIRCLYSSTGTVPATGSGVGSQNTVQDFSTPIRFALKSGDILRLDVQNFSGAAVPVLFSFSLRGYTMGALQTGTANSAPYRIMGLYTEHPYPQDDWTAWGAV